jgi:hypothetical protein
MLNYRESKISAHHNYVLNDMLTPGFVIGKPNSKDSFYFLADLVLPGESTPRISSRIMDENGELILELNWNRMSNNRGRCTFRSTPNGFQILRSSGEQLLEVNTRGFPNGYLTRIKGRLHDESGKLRIDRHGDSIEVYESTVLVLESPFEFSSK